jgi:hypothetical protein
MSALAPIADKLGKLIRLLGSDRDGEVVAAAQALQRTLKSAGADLHTLADLVEKPNGHGLSEADMKRIYSAGFEAGLRKAEDAQHGPEAFRDIGGRVTWQSMALYCQQHSDRLREDRHKEFVGDMAAKAANNNWGRDLTPKQLSYLQSLYFKLGGKPA